jgi:hypothetical protein
MPALLSTHVVSASIAGGTSPHTVPFLQAVPAGAFLSILVGDGFGYPNSLTGVSDSQGNVYTLDSAVNEADGDGSVFVASSHLAHALTPSDTLTLTWDSGAWPHAYVTGVSFSGPTVVSNAGTPVGRHGSGSITATATPIVVGDLAIGFACYQFGAVTDDPGWTGVETDGDSENHIVIAYETATGTTASYTTSSTGMGYAASVVVAYTVSGGPPPPPPPPPGSEIGFTTLSDTHLGSGWHSQGDFGFYVHRNAYYLQGEIYNDATATRTLLTGLRAPAAPAHVTLHADVVSVRDVATPGITVPMTFAATVGVDGSLALDALPPYVNAAPGPPYTHEHYSFPSWTVQPDFDAFVYTIVLGDVPWPVGPALPDSPAFSSLAPYLDTSQFVDIDSEYAVSDSRAMLRGRVRAVIDAPSALSESLPAGMRTALSPIRDSYAVARAPSGPAIIDLETPFAFVEEAIDNRPSQGTYLPSGIFGASFAGLRDLAHDRVQVTTPSIQPFYDVPVLSGFGPQAGIMLVKYASWDNGVYYCTDGVGGSTACNQQGPCGLVTIDVADLLAALYPQPQWFALWGYPNAFGSDDTGTYAQPYRIGCGSPGFFGPTCGPEGYGAELNLYADVSSEIHADGASYRSPTHHQAAPVTWTTGASDYSFTDPWGSGYFDSYSNAYAFAHPADSVEYTGDPLNPNCMFLWRPGEINSVTFEMTGLSHVGSVEFALILQPYYEYAEHGLRAGDVLTLDGAGWQAAYTAPPFTPPIFIPGNMRIGAGARAQIRYGRQRRV